MTKRAAAGAVGESDASGFDDIDHRVKQTEGNSKMTVILTMTRTRGLTANVALKK